MKKEYIKYIFALLLFGSNGIVASNINLPSMQIVLMRTMTGSILLILIYLIGGNKFTGFKHKKDLIFIAFSGIAMGGSWICLYEAYKLTGVGIASLLYYSGPVIVMALSPFLFKEKLKPVKLIGFAAVICGILMINGNSINAINKKGFILGILSAIMYAIMITANKGAKNIDGKENSTIQLFVSFIAVAIFTMITGNIETNITCNNWIWIMILGISNTGIGCLLYFSSIGKLPIQTVAVCGYIEPLSAVILSAFLLKEKMNTLQIIGAILIIGGALFAEISEQKFKTEKKKRIKD